MRAIASGALVAAALVTTIARAGPTRRSAVAVTQGTETKDGNPTTGSGSVTGPNGKTVSSGTPGHERAGWTPVYKDESDVFGGRSKPAKPEGGHAHR